MNVKAAKIKANRSRRFEAKKTSVAKVDLRGWNGALKQGTHYTKEAKTLILNLISVRIINTFFTSRVSESRLLLHNSQCGHFGSSFS